MIPTESVDGRIKCPSCATQFNHNGIDWVYCPICGTALPGKGGAGSAWWKPHGEWLNVFGDSPYCSACGYRTDIVRSGEAHYCPKCGVKMDEDEDSGHEISENGEKSCVRPIDAEALKARLGITGSENEKVTGLSYERIAAVIDAMPTISADVAILDKAYGLAMGYFTEPLQGSCPEMEDVKLRRKAGRDGLECLQCVNYLPDDEPPDERQARWCWKQVFLDLAEKELEGE